MFYFRSTDNVYERSGVVIFFKLFHSLGSIGPIFVIVPPTPMIQSIVIRDGKEIKLLFETIKYVRI